MPTYDYFCESCGYAFQKLQKMSDESLKVCPQCGKEVKRLIGAGIGVISPPRADHPQAERAKVFMQRITKITLPEPALVVEGLKSAIGLLA